MGRFKTTWKHLRRSPYQAMAAIFIMFFTFFMASIFVMLAYGFDRTLNYFESKPQATVFLKDDAKEKDILSLRDKLNETGKISTIKYISKEEALKIYKDQFKSDPLLLEMVSSSILPASLEISTKDIKDLNSVSEVVSKEPLVEEVVLPKDIINDLIVWTTSVRTIGIALVSFLVFESILVIMIVIGMKIAVRRQEIEILRLVGATSWYIRWPFIFEGIIYGLVGAVLAWGASYLLLIYATPFLSTFLAGIPLLPVSYILMLYLLGALCAGGVLVGSIGSMVSVWRYLKN